MNGWFYNSAHGLKKVFFSLDIFIFLTLCFCTCRTYCCIFERLKKEKIKRNCFTEATRRCWGISRDRRAEFRKVLNKKLTFSCISSPVLRIDFWEKFVSVLPVKRRLEREERERKKWCFKQDDIYYSPNGCSIFSRIYLKHKKEPKIASLCWCCCPPMTERNNSQSLFIEPVFQM